jgi:ComF family protein
MIHIWQRIIDGIFPPSQSLLTLRQYRDVSYVRYYEPQRVGQTTALSSYQSPLIKASITAGKFEHNSRALRSLGLLLRTHFENHRDLYPPSHTILVPVPLHPKRMRERGYNQVDIILQAAVVDTTYHVVPLLSRTSNTSPQSHLKRHDRLTHLDGVFAYSSRSVDWDTIEHVILVDDVITTGSTLTSASNTLAPHLPKHVTLHTLAIAH